MLAWGYQPARDDTVAQNLLLAVDVVEVTLQGLDTLGDADRVIAIEELASSSAGARSPFGVFTQRLKAHPSHAAARAPFLQAGKLGVGERTAN